MKKFVSLLLCVSLLAGTLSGCAKDLNINGKIKTPYGLFNQGDKDPCVQYRVSVGNVVWGCLLFEVLFIPTVVIFGWFLYEPIDTKDCGQPVK